ncbi:hypothetical protein [Streptomyces sp. NBC_00557]|uniref:hypothetical protein n=1 Tax=Streptomyces sp. NBC_00557 TaxID=2975776 RepID=UPI002E81D610|nr:hypothetical protein [Streptomyces sp. NBC_00557]WUC36384.1 hypothetical protein OG956_20245 [Streptomyces sp. NBC_00557]
MSVINWGDVPTWLGTVFAAAAAGAAVWTLKSQRDQIREQRVFIAEQSATMALERAELRAAAEDRRWAQARRIRMTQRKAGATTDQGEAVPDNHWVVLVTNDSDAPVKDVEVRFGTAYTAAQAQLIRAATLRPDQPGELLTVPVHLLGAGRTVQFLSQRYSPATVHNNPPTLYFTDDSGVRWSLDSHGDLKETDQQPGS